MSSTDAVTYTRDGHVGVITLNRPNERNSMTAELLDGFREASARARDDDEARAIVITGTGRCFSAGADLKLSLQRDGDLPHEGSYAMYEPFLSVLDIRVPVIGALNGHAVGGGFGLALVCDIRIGNESAQYGANFCRLGFHPGMAITHLLPRLVGASRAAELLYTGDKIDGVEAARIGILSRAVPGDQVLPIAHEIAGKIATNAPIAIRLTKRSLLGDLPQVARETGYREAYAQAATLTTDDAREGISALLEKRTPVFWGK